MAATIKNNYPRALPYRAPEQPADPTIRLRRWTYRLAGMVAVLLVIVTAGVVYLVNEGRSEAAPSDSAESDGAPKAPPVSSTAAAKKTKPATTPATTTDSTLKDRYLEVLGGLSASHLYQTYLNIGLLADGVEKEVYSQEEAEKMLASVADLMKLVDVQLSKVRRGDLTVDDQSSLEHIKAVMGLLRMQSDTLQTYWVAATWTTPSNTTRRAKRRGWA